MHTQYTTSSGILYIYSNNLINSPFSYDGDEEDEEGNGLEHIKMCREAKSSKVKSKYKCKVR